MLDVDVDAAIVLRNRGIAMLGGAHRLRPDARATGS